jgi:hypothetical protein
MAAASPATVGAATSFLLRHMIPDIDIWRCAQLRVNNHGDEAALEAATMADDFLSKGNIEAQRVWMRIAKAIDALHEARKAETQH